MLFYASSSAFTDLYSELETPFVFHTLIFEVFFSFITFGSDG